MKWIVDKLEKGLDVTFRPSGHSMSPLIKHKQKITIIPYYTPDIGDVVLCKVKGNIYLHQVKATGNKGYLIGNMKGYINGWTKKIYGKVIEL